MRLLYTILFTFICITLQAQKPHGYYITPANDTVQANYWLKDNQLVTLGFTKGYNLYEELVVLKDDKNTTSFKPEQLKEFFIEWNEHKAQFISLPTKDGKLKFQRPYLFSTALDVYEYSTLNSNNGGVDRSYSLYKPDSSFIFVSHKEGNIKARKRLRAFFASDKHVLVWLDTLFTQPGFVERDMAILIQKIFNANRE